MAGILLIYPNPVTLLEPQYPHGLLALAAYLIRRGHKVRIIDERLEDYTMVLLGEFDCVGISVMTGQVKNGLKIAKWIRQKDASMPILWGGVHPSLMPEQTAKNEYVDIVVRGEGEETLSELIECFESKRGIDQVKGITYRKDGVVYSTPDREYLDMDQLPLLPYEILPSFNEYSNSKCKIIHIQTSRGCPHQCGFCCTPAVHKRGWRAKSPTRVVEELKYMCERFKPDTILILDDEFFVNRKRVEEICEGIIESGLNIKWEGATRCSYAYKYDKAFFDMLKESGLVRIGFGGESGSPMILNLINKGTTTEQMRITVRKFKENDIHSTVSFMAGFPNETREDLLKTFDIIDELTEIDSNLTVAGINIYTPFPTSTPLYQEALAHGLKEPKTLEEWGEFHFNDVCNLPWLDKSTKALLRTINLLTKVEFIGKGRYEVVLRFEGSRLTKAAYKIFSWLAKFRWRHRFFYFPVEWLILDYFLKSKKMAEAKQ